MESKLRNHTIQLTRVPEVRNRENERETTDEVVAGNLPELKDNTCPWFTSTKFQVRKLKLNPHLDTL